MVKAVFARIGYMRYYRGRQGKGEIPMGKGERPKWGGSYNRNEIGFEAYNFKPDVDGTLYGHFEVPTGGKLKTGGRCNLKRIDPSYSGGDSAKGVLVVFAHRDVMGSNKPKSLVIAGWYRNATVYERCERYRPKSIAGDPSYKLKQNPDYNIEAKVKDAVLIPLEQRKQRVLTAPDGIGHSNLYYAREPNGDIRHGKRQWVTKALNYIESYNGRNLMEELG